MEGLDLHLSLCVFVGGTIALIILFRKVGCRARDNNHEVEQDREPDEELHAECDRRLGRYGAEENDLADCSCGEGKYRSGDEELRPPKPSKLQERCDEEHRDDLRKDSRCARRHVTDSTALVAPANG